MPALSAYRKDLARRAGVLKEVTTGVLYSGSYGGAASGSAAARRIVSSDLASSNLAGTAAELPATSQNYRYAWSPTTREQRRIVANGYTAHATASSVLTGHNASADAYVVGYVTLDRALAATLAGNVAAEIHQWPILANEERPGLHWAINEALSLMHWPRAVSISGVTGQSRYDLTSTAPWVKQTGQLIRVYRPEEDSATGPDPMLGRPYLEPNGDKMYLHIPEDVATGETFTVQLRMPCLNWILVKRQAYATANVVLGEVATYTVNDGGTGYTSATATVSGNGTLATASVTVSGGSVTAVTPVTAGLGYTAATVAISAPNATTWTASTVGLVNDQDEALPAVDKVTAVAYALLARRMVKAGPKPQAEEWAKEAEQAEAACRDILAHQVEPHTPRDRRTYRVPTHPTGKSWRAAVPGWRRGWPR